MNCLDCNRPTRGPYARYCDDDRWRHRGKPLKYVWTPERDDVLRRAAAARGQRTKRGEGRFWVRVAAVTNWGWPAHALQQRALRLGLCFKRTDYAREWTADEERFLMEHAGRRHLRWLAKKLGRTETSVATKMKREGIRRRFAEGYTMRDLELCFGEDHGKIRQWIVDGLLGARRRGTARPAIVDSGSADPWFVTDADLLAFVLKHPMVFDLRRVDQRWFMDMITGGAVVRAELARLKAGDREEDRVA